VRHGTTVQENVHPVNGVCPSCPVNTVPPVVDDRCKTYGYIDAK